ncbi:MAG: DUF3997 domain-containing protein [Kiritimatiellaeota bacterium]|nr:DUF3997 domain-containing protein [Kiritimatiellota bacterium]
MTEEKDQQKKTHDGITSIIGCLGVGFALLCIGIAFMFIMCANVGPGTDDFEAELCGGYLLFRSSVHQIIVVPPTRIWNDTTPHIPTKVVEIGHDKRFIIAKRNELERRYPDDPNSTYMQPAHDVFDYWILDTSIPEVYGHLTQEEFTQKRHALGVPDNIVLKDVYKFRKK